MDNQDPEKEYQRIDDSKGAWELLATYLEDENKKLTKREEINAGLFKKLRSDIVQLNETIVEQNETIARQNETIAELEIQNTALTNHVGELRFKLNKLLVKSGEEPIQWENPGHLHSH